MDAHPVPTARPRTPVLAIVITLGLAFVLGWFTVLLCALYVVGWAVVTSARWAAQRPGPPTRT